VRRILIVATDVALRARLVALLKGAGYTAEIAEPPARAHERNLRGVSLALVVPDGLAAAKTVIDGLEARSPVLLLWTARSTRIAGRDMIDSAEDAPLLAEIAKMLDAGSHEPPPPPVLRFPGYYLDQAAQTLLRDDGAEVRLTPGEFRLLRAFAERPRRVLSRDTLLSATRGTDGDADRGIDMLLMRLRRKIEPDPRHPTLILTVPGSGYRFAQPVEKLDTLPAFGTPPPPAAAELATPGRAVRRRVTILCAELVAAPGARLPADPEQHAALVAAHRARVAALAAPCHGVLGRGFANTVPVYFGLPAALEHAGECAVVASMDIASAAGPGWAVRVGVAAGLVMASHDGDIAGEAPGLALALQSRAAPGQVVIGPEVRRAVGGLFRCQALPAGGQDEAWRVLGRAPLQNRFRALRGDPIAMVGRADEVALLTRRWEQARGGDGRVVWVFGEAGIGKSRLVRSMLSGVDEAGAWRLSFDCAPTQAESPLHPFVNFLQRQSGGGLARLRRLLRPADASDAEASVLAGLLGAADLPQASPQARKAQIFATLQSLLVRLCERRPMVLVCEDAHWADSLSLELLDRLCRDAAELPLLLVVTSRPEFSPPWADEAHVTPVKLNRLGRQDAVVLAHAVACGRPLLAEMTDRILARTDGVPLFVEEFTRTVLESGAASQAMERFRLGVPLDVPANLHDSLMVRLDRLGWARSLAQCAAALGREFTQPLLAAVAGLPPARLEAGLATLCDAQLVARSGATYSFRHALLRDAAYGSLPMAERPALHQRIADGLHAEFPAMAQTEPATLAYHLTEAGAHQTAVPLWRLAGERNIQASANLEAAVHFRRALAILAGLPASPSRDAMELEIRVKFSVALTGTSGYTSHEFCANTTRALDLCEHGAATLSPSHWGPVLWSMVAGAFSAGDMRSARDLAARFMREAEALGDRQLCMIAHRLQGMVLFGAGEGASARAHLERSLALYDSAGDKALAAVFGFDQFVASLSYLGRTLQLLGLPEQALATAARAVQAAEAQGHAISILYAQYSLMSLHMSRREPEAVTAKAREAGRLARAHGAYNYQEVSHVVEQVAALRAGAGAPALAAIGRHLQALRDINWIYFVTRLSLYAAEAAAETGHLAQGRAWWESARALIEDLDQTGCLADMHRVHAALLHAEAAIAA
jgi:DNA-binding response OmpR family regulator/class 3 adenylate cyclase